MPWTEITAAERAAFKPIRARFVDKYRSRDRSIREHILLGRQTSAYAILINDGVNENTWITIGTFRLWVPAHAAGGTTTLTLSAKITADASAASPTSQGGWRLRRGADTGTELFKIPNSSSLITYPREDFALSFTPAAGAVNDIDVQGHGDIDVATMALTFIWDDEHEGALSTVDP